MSTLQIDKKIIMQCIDTEKKNTLLNQYNKEGFPALLRLAPPYDWANFLLARAQPDGVDLDVSPVAMQTYCLMYGWDLDKIRSQANKRYKYQIEHGSHIYRGDTMTSAWTVWRKYMELKLKSDEKQLEKLEGIIYYHGGAFRTPVWSRCSSFSEYFEQRVIPNAEIFTQFLAVANDCMSQQAKEFCKIYWSIGNFLMVPLYFNQERSGPKNADYDTADRLLWKLYRYFVCGKQLDELFFENDAGRNARSVHHCKQWLVDCGVFDDMEQCTEFEKYTDSDERRKKTWERFLEIHLLKDFVDDNLYPISFKHSTPGNKTPVEKYADKNGEYFPLPQIEIEFENFFLTANDCIRKREVRIWDKKIKDNI